MGWMHPAAIEHQRRRLMRPDAARWLRPDAARWLPPEVMRLFEPLDRPAAKSAPPAMSADEYDRELESIRRDYLELKAMLAVRKFERTWATFRAKAYNPDQPRVPAGNPDGGQWTDAAGGQTIRSGERGSNETSDAPTDISAVRLPKIPPKRPPTTREQNSVIKEVAGWLAKNGIAAAEVVARASWLYQAYPYIDAYLDAPKSLDELQELARSPEKGYDIHHMVEQTPAANDGFPRALIQRDDNLVRIPTLKHWEINAWFQRLNDDYGGMSPREYLRGKDWDERQRVGLDALIRYGVLKP